jgi:hypothetical protein
LRYCRYRFFTFVFFMQNLSGISSGQNNKSCRIFHRESKKLVLHFSDFSVIFYAIYKKQEIHFAVRPSERNVALQCSPWGRPAGAGGSIPVSAGGETRRGRRGGGLGVSMVRFGGSDGESSRRRSGHAGGRRRWPPRL